ncbi:hypothetical protein GDO86_015578 [Hymenochirus boettgeri]|uniref:Uncharacterized protein n=1 Tax=Hymenochirus boettgeri TaxID=247094 RepID=A0A8T2K1U0_9PIPI|nr:hypothetical protein GDO86_015578 [Hymenochirus boettgeri]
MAHLQKYPRAQGKIKYSENVYHIPCTLPYTKSLISNLFSFMFCYASLLSTVSLSSFILFYISPLSSVFHLSFFCIIPFYSFSFLVISEHIGLLLLPSHL